MYHLRDCATGGKKCKSSLFVDFILVDIKAEKIRHISCPLYPGLTLDALFEFAARYPVTEEYLPDVKDRHRLPRSYLANVIFTLVGDDFANYVQKKITERNSKLVQE